MRKASPYNGGLTREQFLFHEMRTTAKLMDSGMTDEQIVTEIMSANLFQFPTEKMIGNLARVCVSRLHALNDPTLVSVIANQPSDVAKQVCLYSIMKHNRLAWDFMITVIGEKYRLLDNSFSKMDVNAFFMRLQEQDDAVASWSDATIQKIKSVLVRFLVENGYLDSHRSTVLNPISICDVLEASIRSAHDELALPAFNCLT